MQEQGMKDFDVTSWLGMYAPAQVDPAIIAQLSTIGSVGGRFMKQRSRSPLAVPTSASLAPL
ncbi:hypothetical protein LLE87_30000 [Paenibacillus polymyxa]|nr:hypothetical protein [Paenibacillus polymyxa]